MKFHHIVLVLVTVLQVATYAQGESIKPIRVGVKLLSPNIGGFTLEGVPPILENRLGLELEYTNLPFGNVAKPLIDYDGEVDASINVLAIGANFYLKNNQLARGPYFGASYMNFSVDTEVTANSSFDVKSEAKAEISTINLKLGTKTGKGAFFFGFEIGAGIPIDGPKGIFLSEADGKVEFEAFDKDDLPVPVLPIFNFSLGIALF